MQLLWDLVQLSQLHPARGSPRPPEVDQRRKLAGSHIDAPCLEHRQVVRVLEGAGRHVVWIDLFSIWCPRCLSPLVHKLHLDVHGAMHLMLSFFCVWGSWCTRYISWVLLALNPSWVYLTPGIDLALCEISKSMRSTHSNSEIHPFLATSCVRQMAIWECHIAKDVCLYAVWLHLSEEKVLLNNTWE